MSFNSRLESNEEEAEEGREEGDLRRWGGAGKGLHGDGVGVVWTAQRQAGVMFW